MYFPACLLAHLSQHVFRDVPPLRIPAGQQRRTEPGEASTAALHRPLKVEVWNTQFQGDSFCFAYADKTPTAWNATHPVATLEENVLKHFGSSPEVLCRKKTRLRFALC